MAHHTPEIDILLGQTPVMPVVTFNRLEEAQVLGELLVESHVPAIEVTLRTEVALPAIKLLRKQFPGLTVAAGTLRCVDDMLHAQGAGAQLLVSPCCTLPLLEGAASRDLPLLPGVATPTEMQQAYDFGFECQKLFPAHALGGLELLRAIQAPMPELRFCPTGGIDHRNALQYLTLPNVICVGSSWLTPRDLLRDGKWDEIRQRIATLLQLLAA